MVNAIGRHTHPSSVHNLFTFDYTRTLKSVKGTSNGHGEGDGGGGGREEEGREWRRRGGGLGVGTPLHVEPSS